VLKMESAQILEGTATVSGLADIYPRLKSFQERMRKFRSHSAVFDAEETYLFSRPRKLYFVKVDIVRCFDSINQAMLTDILKDIVKEEEYLVQKYSVTFASVGKIKRNWIKRAKTAGEFVQFEKLAKEIAENLRNTIVTDGVVYSLEERENLLQLLEEHICNNLVKMGKRFYRQLVGIPQGSVLSSLLCSLFLSHLERRKLQTIISRNDLLLRLVDDLLFITPVQEKAIEFINLFHQGIADYGCSVNPTKTVVNFDYVYSGIQLKRVEYLSSLKSPNDFPWCGLLINMKRLVVKADYTRLAGTGVNIVFKRSLIDTLSDIKETLSVEYSRRPWVSLKTKMFQYVSLLLLLFPDARRLQVNSEAGVLLNVYQSFLICAMKLYSHVKTILATSKHGPPPATPFLLDVIGSTIQYMYGLVRSRGKRVIGLSQLPTTAVNFLKVEWLGLRAFWVVLSRKQSKYTELLQELGKLEQDGKFASLRNRMKQLQLDRRSKALDAIIY
ncbi:hypothetical protein HDU82_001240, partial [Entophlyctis luteolus]